jgi:ribosomal subunit interface protein
MRIILSGVGFKTSEPLRAYAEQRVLSWLGHLQREIEVVTIQLASEGDKEARRTQCRLLARPVGGERLVVEETSADVYEAIDGAPERMAEALKLAMRKRRRPAHAGV